MDTEKPPQIRYTNRWLCYLDLLGFRARVAREEIGDILELYNQALEEIQRGTNAHQSRGVACSWFSDTFIIFSRGGGLGDFTSVEQAGRLFFQNLTLQGIPARGAIAYGKFYSQMERNIFIGPALIEAYECGEGQDWIGFSLAPSVFRRLEGTDLDLRQRYHYQPVDLPGVITRPIGEPVYAFAFNNGEINGQNPFLRAVEGMKHKAGPEHAQKYDRTETFIRSHLQKFEGSAG
jgi:hypothetical protein